MKSIIHIATVLLAAVMAAPHAFAADNGDGKGLDVKEIVIEHLGDSYWWHIGKFGDKEVNIALPVIVRGDNGEWHCFSSGHLYDGASYEGFSIAGDGKYKGKIVETLADGSTDRPFDLSVTKTTAGLLLNSLITILLILCAARWYRSHKSRESAPAPSRMAAIPSRYASTEVVCGANRCPNGIAPQKLASSLKYRQPHSFRITENTVRK